MFGLSDYPTTTSMYVGIGDPYTLVGVIDSFYLDEGADFPTYNEAVAMTAGQTFDFIVATDWNYVADSTGLRATITLAEAAVVPEPSTLAGVVGALAVGLGLVWKRRSAGRGTTTTEG